MFPRLSAFVIWSFVAAAAMFWILRFVVHAPQAPAHAVAVDRSAPVRGDLTKLFGAPLVARAEEKAAAPSRYKLIGVMAPKSRSPEGSGAYGLALIAVDGKPARAYAVGSRLDSDLVLQSVGMRTASLGPEQGTRRMLLELPPPTAAATGVLPMPGTGLRAQSQPVPVTPQPMPSPPSGQPTMQPQAGMTDAASTMAPMPPSGAVPVAGVPPATPPPTDGFRNR